MKISDRDRKILIFVLAIVIVAGAYFFGFKKISESNESLDKEIAENRSFYNNLKAMVDKEETYKEDTEVYTSEYNDILAKFDTGYSQEYSILFIKSLEKETETWISQAGLGDTISLYSFGNIASTNPINSGALVYSTDYVGYGTTLTLTYLSSYDGFKTLIDYVNNFRFKCKIDSITCSYNEEKDEVSGSIIITIYAITGSDRFFAGAPVDKKYYGTSNIFDSEIFEPNKNGDNENGNNILTDYDYYISLSSFKAEADSIIVGPRGDTPATRISKNSSEREAVTIKFAGKDGKYTVSYRIGDIAYPAVNYEAGVEFNPGNLLSLLVVASERDMEGDDLSGADVTLINETDMTLQVKVSDDKDNPRFKIKEKSGKIEVFE